MIQAITQAAIEAAKAEIMSVKEIENPVKTAISVQVMPRTGSPALKQSTFDWKAADKY